MAGKGAGPAGRSLTGVDVGGSGEFLEGVPRLLRVDRRDIAFVRWDGELFAFRNVCPHQSSPLCGVIAARVISKLPGRVTSQRSFPVIHCTRHRWEFDLRTGVALADPLLRVKTYEVVESDGRVLLGT